MCINQQTVSQQLFYFHFLYIPLQKAQSFYTTLSVSKYWIEWYATYQIANMYRVAPGVRGIRWKTLGAGVGGPKANVDINLSPVFTRSTFITSANNEYQNSNLRYNSITFIRNIICDIYSDASYN